MAKTAKKAPLAHSARWRLLLLVAFLGLAAYIAAGDGLLLEGREKERDLNNLEGQVSRLAAENDSLRQVLHKLDHDMDYIEKLAREELGLVKPGEAVIALPEED